MRADYFTRSFVVVAFAALLAFAGCAPVISGVALSGVERDVTMEKLLEDPDSLVESTVLLGGAIIKVENKTGLTIVEVLQMPLGRSMKPAAPERSEGRFLVTYEGFKDPVIYKEGRLITVVGVVTGGEERPLGETTYRYPAIEITEDHLWKSGRGRAPVSFGIGVMHSF